MYFVLPGVVSQAKTFVVDGNISGSTELVGVASGDSEVLTTWIVNIPSTLEMVNEIARGRTISVSQISQIEPVKAEELQLVSGFVDLTVVTSVENIVARTLDAKELIRIEAGFGVYGLLISTTELLSIERVESELQPVPEVSYISPITLKTEFLPGSPGYVAGVPGTAVELLGVDVGYPPEPLPIGVSGIASYLTGVNLGDPEVKSTRVACQISTIEGSGISRGGKTIGAIVVSKIEPVDRQAVKVYKGHEIRLIESDCHLVNSIGSADLVSTMKPCETWLYGLPLKAIEISSSEPIEKELQSVPITYYLLPITYAPASAITKP